MSRFSVILPAAGRSTRFGGEMKKVFMPLHGQPVWSYSVRRFAKRLDVAEVILVIAEGDESILQSQLANLPNVRYVFGGHTRTESIANALRTIDSDCELVAVHDAARPGIDDERIETVFQTADQTGAAMLAMPVAGTLKRVDESLIVRETVSREGIWEAQTPQVFRRNLLEQAYREAIDEPATDDAQLVERLGHPVKIVLGTSANLKITTQDDLHLAERLIDPP